jgi:hypothetical protein
MLDRRRKGLIALALLVAALAARHPTADFRLVTHDIGDPQPHRVQAAVDLGLVGVSFLYTWSRRLG